MAVLNDDWQSWLTHNKNRGCTPESMIEAMVQAGFDQMSADAAVRQSLPAGSSSAGTEALVPPRAQHEYQYDPSPAADGNVVDAGDRQVKVAMRCARPQIVVFDNLLSDDECEAMIERSRDKLRPSTTVNPGTGARDVIRARSSEGAWFHIGEDELIQRLERRFATLMSCPVENGEGLQVLRYGVGGEYRQHFDYFPPSQAGSNVHLKYGGQRVATLIVYLNDVDSGGETIFPEIGMSVVARRGGAVYFRYMNGSRQLDPLTLHGGAPVLCGEKWIMTKWVREGPNR